jgi:alpha-L-fucosidase
MKTKFLLLILSVVLNVFTQDQTKTDYLNESKQDFNKRMQWFVDAKYGMFIHCGLYSHLGGVWENDTLKAGDQAEWIQSRLDITPQDYAMITHFFNPKNLNADSIVPLQKEPG